MQIHEILGQTGGIAAIARELGLSEDQAARGTAALAPAVIGGFKKQAQAQPSGLEGLGGLLARFGGGGLLDDVLGPQPTDVSRGNAVLGQIFGSRDVSRTVAASASAESGVDAGVLKKMLPLLAMLVAGYMAKKRESAEPRVPPGGGVAALLGGPLDGSAPESADSEELAAMLGWGAQDNPLDDILRSAGGAPR